jgi:hypothetical protein
MGAYFQLWACSTQEVNAYSGDIESPSACSHPELLNGFLFDVILGASSGSCQANINIALIRSAIRW